jgi:hypothetical protein
MKSCTADGVRQGQDGRARALQLLTGILECFLAILTGRAAFLLLVPRWGSSPALLASAAVGCIVFSLSIFAIVHQAPLRTSLRQFAQLHGEDALDALFFLSLPASIAVLAESLAAFTLLGTPFPPPLLRALVWGGLQFLILVPVYIGYRRAKSSEAAAEPGAL